MERKKRYLIGHWCGPRPNPSAERGINSFELGQAVLKSSERPLSLLIASPLDTHWSRLVAELDMEATKTAQITLKKLLATGTYDWGHRWIGFRAGN